MPQFNIGQRVEVLPHTDLFMRGERFGDVVSIGRKWIRIRGERSGRIFRFHCETDGLKPYRKPRYLMAPAERRLADYRDAAESIIPVILKHWPEGEARDRYIAQRANWRDHRPSKQHHGGVWQSLEEVRKRNPHAADDARAYYIDSFARLGLRDIGTAEEVSKAAGSRAVDHSGWFNRSADQSETISGRVLQLPARGGKPCYIPAVEWSDADGVTLYPLQQFDEPLEAARRADALAEATADDEREYNDAWRAGSDAAGLLEELAAERKSALAAIAGLGRTSPARAKILSAYRDKREETWLGVADCRERAPYGQDEAFNEGFGR